MKGNFWFSPGDLVSPVKPTTVLDTSISDKPGKVTWASGNPGLILELEAEPPVGAAEENWMVRVLTDGGIGWCFQDEAKIIQKLE